MLVKNLIHKLLRPLLNYWGKMKGVSGCFICGDRWNWKKEHIIIYRIDKSGIKEGAFPVCEECWGTAPKHLIEIATRELARRWILQSPPQYLKETLKNVKSLMIACKKQLVLRG